MFKSRTFFIAFIFAFSAISSLIIVGQPTIVEALVTSTPTPSPTSPPTQTATPTATSTRPGDTFTLTATPTPCQEEMGCAGIPPTLSQAAPSSLILLIISFMLLITFWLITAVSHTRKSK